MRYTATPMLSVEAVHAAVIVPSALATAVGDFGVVGLTVSGITTSTVTGAGADSLPAPSRATITRLCARRKGEWTVVSVDGTVADRSSLSHDVAGDAEVVGEAATTP